MAYIMAPLGALFCLLSGEVHVCLPSGAKLVLRSGLLPPVDLGLPCTCSAVAHERSRVVKLGVARMHAPKTGSPCDTCWSIHMSRHMSIHISVHTSIHMPIHMSIQMSI